MAITDKDIDTIDQYVNGLLSRDDLVKFERRLEQEEAIAQQVVSMKALRHSAKASVLRDKMKMLQQWDAGMGEVEEEHVEGDEVNDSSSNAKVRWIGWLKYAASVLVLVSAGLFFKQWNDQRIYDDLAHKYAGIELPDSPLQRTRSVDVEENISPELRKAFDIYDFGLIELEQQNYVDADKYLKMSLELLEKIQESVDGSNSLQRYIDAINRIK